jgi:non-ribosomal peptide synthetase component E (peptide arylation enzyme)
VILGDGSAATAAESGTTLDAIFRRTVARRPDAVAVADPPNRASFTDGEPRRLTYAQADRIVSAIAARMRRLGLATDAVIAVQLPSTVENVLTVLGILRAGMIAASLPLLWRQSDLIAGLGRIGAKAIVTSARAGGFDHCALAMQAAAELFPVRYVCGFGPRLPDGVIPLDDLMTGEAADPPSAVERDGPAAAHVAVVTFDVAPNGPIAVARSHRELVAGGLAVLLEGGIGPDASIVTSCAIGSFAGLSLAMLPWLISGGTLSLHQPFDAAVFKLQCSHERDAAAIVPGPLVPRLAEAGLFDGAGLKTVLALWRAPERLASSPPWPATGIGLVDVRAFGETALFAMRRDAEGRPRPVPAGVVQAPHDAAGAVTVLELARTESGTLALRGPMVPRHAFPPGAERSAAPHFRAGSEGFADTGYACRLDRDSRTVAVTGPPPGVVAVGGYRFVLRELEDAVGRADREAGLAALPDALGGNRLAGSSAEPERMRAALAEQGVNPLLAGAFRNRHSQDAA